MTAEQFAHQRGFRRPIREKTRPARHKTPISVHFSFAGRTCSPTGHSDVARLKPMTPLRPLMQASVKPPSPLFTHEQQPLKPTTPLQPKNTHFPPAKAMTVSSEARPARAKATPVSRERFPMPAGYGGAWPSGQRAADVTNVVKPTRFKSPHEDPCYKRRQSKPKNQHFQRKSPQIDDVCNNGVEIHTKNTLE